MANNDRWLGTLVTVVIVALIGLGIWWYMSDTQTSEQTDTSTTTTQTLPGGLIVEDVQIGTGAEAVPGQRLSMHYVGTLDNGSVFDSSRTRGVPFEFVLGAGQVIPGWDQGIVGMKVGGVRKLTIPPALGYGGQTVGPIPANSTLHFEVELVEVK